MPQPEPEGKGLLQPRPETGILHPTMSRLPVSNRVLLGSWMVDICQECGSLRSAPQRRGTEHLRQRSRGTPRKPSGWDQGGDEDARPTWDSAFTKHLVS